MLSKTSVHHFTGTNVALGTAAGKLFRVGSVCFVSLSCTMIIADLSCRLISVMTILDQGDSDLLNIVETPA